MSGTERPADDWRERLFSLDAGIEALLTRKEVAKLLSVSEGYLRNTGGTLLPIVRIGGSVRHRLSDVRALALKREPTQTEDAA
jgi:hypothetical protein